MNKTIEQQVEAELQQLSMDHVKNPEKNDYTARDLTDIEALMICLNREDGNFMTALKRVQMELAETTKKLGEENARNNDNYSGNDIQNLATEIESAYNACRKGKEKISSAKSSIALNGLKVIVHYRKKKRLIDVLRVMKEVKQIYKIYDELEDHLSRRDFPTAIETIRHIAKTIHLPLPMLLGNEKQNGKVNAKEPSLADLNCVKGIEKNLQHVEKRLDDNVIGALEECCESFKGHLYQNILLAYKKKPSIRITYKDVIKNYYETNIMNRLKKTVESFVYPRYSGDITQLATKHFGDLCKLVHFEDVLPCCLAVFSVTSDMIKNYTWIMKWHQEHSELEKYSLKHEQKMIEKNKVDIWNKVQTRMGDFLQSVQFSHFKIDQFLQIFYCVNIFIVYGEHFSHASVGLRESLVEKCKSYFYSYHRTQILEGIKMMIENDNWRRFNYKFKFSELNIQSVKNQSTHELHCNKVCAYLDSDAKDDVNPFDVAVKQRGFEVESISEGTINVSDGYTEKKKKKKEDQQIASTTDSPLNMKGSLEMNQLMEGLDKIQVNEHIDDENRKDDNVITNASLSIIKNLSTYMHSLEILQDCEIDIFFCYTTLFKLYFVCVHRMFAIDGQGTDPLQDIDEKLKRFMEVTDKSLSTCNKQANIKSQFSYPTQTMVNFSSDNAFALRERATAAENLKFVLEVAKHLEPRMVQLLPKKKRGIVGDFINDLNYAKDRIRYYIFERYVVQAIQFEPHVSKIASHNFTPSNPPESVSSYMLTLMNAVRTSLNEILYYKEDISEAAIKGFWDAATRNAVETLLDGYARVKKLNDIGQAQMQFDVQQGFQMPLSEVSAYPIPKMDDLKEYINAFYLQESDALQWVKDHRDTYAHYQAEHIILLGPAKDLKKKAKNALLQQIEQVYTSAGMPVGTPANGNSTSMNSFVKSSKSIMARFKKKSTPNKNN